VQPVPRSGCDARWPSAARVGSGSSLASSRGRASPSSRGSTRSRGRPRDTQGPPVAVGASRCARTDDRRPAGARVGSARADPAMGAHRRASLVSLCTAMRGAALGCRVAAPPSAWAAGCRASWRGTTAPPDIGWAATSRFGVRPADPCWRRAQRTPFPGGRVSDGSDRRATYRALPTPRCHAKELARRPPS